MNRYDYSPITARPSGRWPSGHKLALYVAVGVEDYRPDDGHVEDLLPGVAAPDLVNRSWRDYGNRVGAFRLLDRLQGLGIPPTVLLNTMIYDTAPAVTDAARAAGAEIVAHGISNSDSLAELDDLAQLAYLRSVASRIAAEEAAAPGGWSSPWLAHTTATLDLLAQAGYRYLLDLRADDQPIWLTTDTEPVLAIPYALELNDSTSIIGRQATAADFADMIIDEFTELLLAADERPLVMSVVVHSFISGAPFRLRQLSRALAQIAASHDVWLTQPGEIYRAYTALSAPVGTR